jgi:hypothetical protein
MLDKPSPPQPGAGRSATVSRVSTEGFEYSWATGYQNFSRRRHVTGLWALQQNAQPSVDDPDWTSEAHSLGQLWAIARRGPYCTSDVEMGWTVAQGQYGDTQPHLFIYAWDCGVGLGYAGQSPIPWVQRSDSIAPNAALKSGPALHLYGTELKGGNWWFNYDGQWVGYIPRSAWTRLFPTTIQEGEVGGEVATPEPETCTTMGNEGLYGTNRRAALVAYAWYKHGRVATPAKLYRYSTDPQYTTGGWRHGGSGPRFRYGGPGWCGA